MSPVTDKDFRYLINNLGDYAVFVIDPNGIIRTWNKGAEKIFGYREKAILGKNFSILFLPEDVKRKAPQIEIKTATKKGRADDERHHIRKDGTMFWSSGVLSKITDEKGRLVGFSKVCRDTSERKKTEETVRHQAMHDKLTGLPNRRAFDERGAVALHRAKRQKEKLALLYLDLDGFKGVNDLYGHDIGDLLLQEISARLASTLRQTDILARFGGDEFVILLTGVRTKKQILNATHKVISSLEPQACINNIELYPQTSIGIAIYPDHAATLPKLLLLADEALYLAKSNHKSVYETYKK